MMLRPQQSARVVRAFLKFWIFSACFISLFLSHAQESIDIAVITSLTGRFSEFGRQHKAGFELALEDIQAAGGIQGKTLKVMIEDDRSNQAVALSSAERLIKQDVSLILGAYSSSITNPLASYLTREAFPLLVFTSSADGITRPGSPWVFRLNQPSTTYAEVLFDVLDQLRLQGQNLETVAIVHGNGSFETAVAEAAKSFSKERDYLVLESEAYDRGITDFRPVLSRFKTQTPDVLFMVSYSEDAVALLRQAKEVDINPKLYVGAAAGFALPNFIQAAGENAETVITATAWTRDIAHDDAERIFAELTEKLGQAPSYHAVQAYIGLMTAADALQRAESFDPEGIQEALKGTQLEQTAYGPISFPNQDGYQQQNPIKMLAMQVQDGEFITIYPLELRQEEILFPKPWDER